MSTVRELDAVALRRPLGRWAAGTTGAVVEVFDEEAALVELVGPDGCTVEMLTVPLHDLTVVRRPGSSRGSATERVAG
ncbi:MAG: DUF4926 domain-containing protein [Nocardioidaceae bacterium]